MGYQVFEKQYLESNSSIRLDDERLYAFLLLKSTEYRLQLEYHPVLHSKF